jgi:signal transduction histidine kinase
MRTPLRSLYGRISMLYLILALALVLLCAWVTVRHFGLFISEVEQKLNRELAQNIAHELQDSLHAGAYEASVRSMGKHLAMLHPSLELYVLDGRGRILAHSPASEEVQIQQVSTAPIQALLNNSEPLPIWGDYPCDPSDPKVFSAAPVALAGAAPGYVYVILRGKAAGSAASMLQNSYIVRTLGLSLLIVLGFTGVVGVALFALLTRRFRNLTDVVRRFKAGDHDERMDATPDDEIGELGQAFNEMADTIAAQVEALRQTDEARRELVASVSHDFRTPLTSIRGHAERLLNRSDRDTTAVDQALQTILQNTERLDRLADQLHELSRLDAQQVSPSIEPFSIAELVHDIAVKFQPKAEERGVRLAVDRDDDLPAVHADIGLIERLISNLVDNALGNTPEGGRVHVNLSLRRDRVHVQVADTGRGIPNDEIPLVTQRFYQIQRDGDEAPRGSGLGLSIAAEIAELHASALNIDSAVDKGTRIAFHLPTEPPASAEHG